MEVDIRKKRKVEKVMEFVERIKKMQEDMKRQVDRRRKKSEEQKKRDRVMLSMKDLVFKERPAKKLVDQYISPYTIEEVVFTNIVKL